MFTNDKALCRIGINTADCAISEGKWSLLGYRQGLGNY